MLSPMAKSQSKTTNSPNNQFPEILSSGFSAFIRYSSITSAGMSWRSSRIPAGSKIIIEASKHGDKIPNQVNRTEGVGQDDAAQELCVPGHTRVALGKILGPDIPLQAPRPLLPVHH